MAKEKSPLSKALKKSADVIAPVVDEGTVLRIDIPVKPRGEGDTDHLTYAALYVNNRWYLSGEGSMLGRNYEHTAQLLQAVTRHNGTIELATEFDSIR